MELGPSASALETLPFLRSDRGREFSHFMLNLSPRAAPPPTGRSGELMLLAAAMWQWRASALGLKTTRAGVQPKPEQELAVLTGSGLLEHGPSAGGLVQVQVASVEQWERKLGSLDAVLDAHPVARVDLLVPHAQLDMVRVLALVRLREAQSTAEDQLELRGQIPLRFHGVADPDDVALALATLHESQASEEELTAKLGRARRTRREAQIRGDDTEELDIEIQDLQRQIQEGPALEPGSSLAEGRLELLEMVGEGGFAQVWRSYDHARQEVVAVRVLHRRWGQDRTRVEAFFNGAHQMARLRHPNIGAILLEENQEGRDHYFVMEFFPGGDLHAAVREEGLRGRAAYQAIHQVGLGLQHAHAQGIVHGDVKPSNILLNAEGEAVLTDFDLARITTTSDGTRTAAMGSFVFCAPEVLEGRRAPDQRSDIYSLAATTVFALGGAKVSTLALLRDAEGVCEQLPCPQALRDLLVRALSPSPELRPSDAGVFVEASAKILAAPWTEKVSWLRSRRTRRRFAVAVLGAAAFLLAVQAANVQGRRASSASEIVELRARALELMEKDASAALALLRAASSLWLAETEVGSPPLQIDLLRRMEEGSGLGMRIETRAPVMEVMVLEGSGRIATGHTDGSLAIWDMETGASLQRVPTALKWVTDIQPTSEPDRVMVWDRKDLDDRRVVQLIDLSNAEAYRTLSGDGRLIGVGLSPDGTSLLLHEAGGQWLRVLSTQGEERPRIVRRPIGLLGVRPVIEGGELMVDMLGVDGQHRRADVSPSGDDFLAETSATLHRFEGKFGVAGGPEGAWIWDTHTGTLLAELDSPAERLIELSSDGQRVLLDGLAAPPELWSTLGAQRIATLEGHAMGLADAAFSADSQLLATASHDGLIQVWSADSGRALQALRGHDGAVLAVQLVEEEGRPVLVSAGRDRTLRIWTSSFEPANLLRAVDLPSPDEVHVAWTSDGRAVLQVASGALHVLDLSSGERRDVGHLPWQPVVAAASCDRLIALSSEDELRVVDAIGEPCAAEVSVASSGQVVLSPDAALLAHLHHEGLDVWSVATQERVASISASRRTAGLIRFSADGQRLWVAQKAGPIEAFDPWSGTSVQRLDSGDEWVSQLLDTPDGRLLIASTWDDGGRVVVWDAERGAILHRLDGHDAQVVSVALSPDASALATASWDHVVKVWALESGEELHSLNGHDAELTRVAFSPDGSLLASGAKDGTVLVWDLAQGSSRGLVTRHGAATTGLRFLSDAQLYSHDSQGRGGVWSVPSTQTLEELLEHTGGLTNLRVCRSTLEVVAVSPFPEASNIWAPEQECSGAAQSVVETEE